MVKGQLNLPNTADPFKPANMEIKKRIGPFKKELGKDANEDRDGGRVEDFTTLVLENLKQAEGRGESTFGLRHAQCHAARR